MFSGIVRGIGRILEQTDTAADRTLTIGLPPQPIGPLVDRRKHRGQRRVPHGDVVCADDRFTADVSAETLAVTTFGRLSVGSERESGDADARRRSARRPPRHGPRRRSGRGGCACPRRGARRS